MTSLKQYLGTSKLLDQIPVPTAIDLLLDSLQIVEPTPALTGTVKVGPGAKPLFLDLVLSPVGPALPYALTKSATGFSLSIDLTKASALDNLVDLIGAGVSTGLVAATPMSKAATGTGAGGKPNAPEEWLEPAPSAAVKVTGLGFAIAIEGTNGSGATMRFSPAPGAPEGMIPLTFVPPTMLFGGTGFGLKLDGGAVLDLSATAANTVPAVIDGKTVTMPSDGDPGWKGLSIRKARLYLPAGAPLFGHTACDVAIDIGISPPGASLVLTARAPARDGMPAMDLRIECIDPTATGLASFAPTLVEAVVTLADKPDAGDATLKFLAGAPVLVRARFSRDPTDLQKLTRLSVALEAQGSNGIMSVKPKGPDDTPAILTIAAAGMATALIADDKLAASDPNGNGHGGTMAKLLLLGAALSKLLSPTGKLVVNRIELDTAGHGLPVGEPLVFLVDYSVDLPVAPLDIGVLKITLSDKQPLRIRMRGVKLSYDPGKSGLERFGLDFEHAQMDVEDAGDWRIEGPGSLFDVLGTRSGKGSIWLEIDLRFKLDLGPIKVSGATVRATLDDSQQLSVSLRGLDATLSLPGLVSAEGKIALVAPQKPTPQTPNPLYPNGGFSASLAAKIIPLNVAAAASVTVNPPMVLVGLDVDLPGPIPLGATGLGLFGLGGTVGIAAALKLPTPSKGPIVDQLEWTPATGFGPAPGQFSFGAQVSVGTLPDLGFDFAAKAGLFLTVPDLAVLGALDARFLSGPISLAQPTAYAGNGVRGTISMLPGKGTQFALEGTFGVPHLVTAKVPVAGSFPIKSNDWYVYLGADGYKQDPARAIGPVGMTVLPDLFPQRADAYLMLRGAGLDHWRGGKTIPSGFVVAFGFGMEMTFGPKPGLYAEVSGGVDVVIATSPMIVAGVGRIDGALHIGPVSLGVSASLSLCMTDNSRFIAAEVCGRIHLLFVTFHKCARLTFGGQATPTIPTPVQSPIDIVAQAPDGSRYVTGQDVNLLDDRYRALGFCATTPGKVPTVWPDALIRIGFAWAPQVVETNMHAFQPTQPEGPAAQPIGSDFLRYDWKLTSVRLVDDESGVEVPGPLSATWQMGKSGDTGELAQPAELVLLTPQGDLWVDRMADAAAAGPVDPKGALATCCQAKVLAKAGWTVATSIGTIMQPTWLPPETWSTDPVQSRVSGAMAFTLEGADGKPVAMEALFGSLPPGTAFIPPIPMAVPETLGGRSFAGILTLPFLKLGQNVAQSLPRTFSATVLLDDWLDSTGVPSDPAGLARAEVVAMCLDPITPEMFARNPLRVFDETGEWPVTIVTLPSNQLGLVFTSPPGRKAGRLTLRWSSIGHFAYLGIGGITAKAAAARKARQEALDKQAQKNKDANANKPNDGNGPAQRCLLQPGRRYRVEVGLQWQGTLTEQADNGQPEPPTVSGWKDWPVQRFYFATAPDPFAPGGTGTATAVPVVGQIDQLDRLYKQQNGFAPELLERHLTGYEPKQSMVDRFRDDPLRAHFDAGHVARLAGLYGYQLLFAMRRTDIAGPGGNLANLTYKLVKPTSGKFLTGAAKAHFDLAAISPCPVPVEGGTMDAPVQLAPRAWYEAFVRVTRDKTPEARLPGVTFRTSRWKGAPDMMAGLGFTPTGAGTRSGDIQLAPTAKLPVSGKSDTAFDAAMAGLDLDGWPVALEPRASVLWRKQPATGTWTVIGFLLESPEPIERPDRTGPATLTAKVAAFQQPPVFGTKVSDRTGSRLLWIADTPFAALGAQLVLTLIDTPLDLPKGAPPIPRSGAMTLPNVPLFAGEVL